MNAGKGMMLLGLVVLGGIGVAYAFTNDKKKKGGLDYKTLEEVEKERQDTLMNEYDKRGINSPLVDKLKEAKEKGDINPQTGKVNVTLTLDEMVQTSVILLEGGIDVAAVRSFFENVDEDFFMLMTQKFGAKRYVLSTKKFYDVVEPSGERAITLTLTRALEKLLPDSLFQELKQKYAKAF